MISLFFYPRPHKLQKLVLRFYACKEHSQGWRIAQLLDAITNRQMRQVAYFSLPKDPQRRKSWLAAISRDKGNLPSNVFVYSDHFEDKYFDKSWDLQNRLFYTDRPIKRKLISTAIPTLLPHKQISTPRKTSEIRAKQKEKEEVKP